MKCYSETNYKGYCVALPEGTYYVGDLAVYGIKANDIASIEIVNDIYQARLYTSTNCTGTNTRRTKSAKALTTSFKDKICSIVVEENPNSTGISTIEKDEDETICKQGSTIVNLAGQRLNKMQRGINIVDGKKIIVN